MTTIRDGESVEMQGSGARPYVLRNVGGVLSCSCPAWRNQGIAIERRTCKHLKKLLGEDAEAKRVGSISSASKSKAAKAAKDIPPLLLAQKWNGILDPAGWWMSEKLDGVRGYWNGERFISRLGNVIHAPEWYTKSLPTFPVDGELWIKRKFFHETNGMVRRQDEDTAVWNQIQFLAFDLPTHTGIFEARNERLQTITAASGIRWFRYLQHSRCTGMAHLKDMLRKVETEGGEGLMLRQPGSFYEVGRSHTLLKVKSFEDADARVIGYNPGAGKYKGMIGSLACKLKSGVTFDVGTGLSDEQRRHPPKIGSVIVVHYKELTKDGVPREPSFHGVRKD